MAEHSLIAGYRDELLRQLPAELADEVADGLADAQEKYISWGLNADRAARAAIEEFGNAGIVTDAFRRTCPAWRLARILIATGPLVGGCWAAALIADRAWQWAIPIAASVLVGVTLAISVVLLAVAARSQRYGAIRSAGLAGCLGVVTLDFSVLTMALVVAPGIRWLLAIAASASAARLAFVVSRMRRLVSQPGA